MKRSLAIFGGIIGAIFTGAAVWAFTKVHTEYTYVANIGIPHDVTGYPDLGALFVALAVIGFVIMIIGVASKASNQSFVQPREPTFKARYCPYCGKTNDPNSTFCGHCGRKMQ